MKDGRVYAYAAARTPQGGRVADGELAELRGLFGGRYDPIPAVLDAAWGGPVLRNDVHPIAGALPTTAVRARPSATPPTPWHRRRAGSHQAVEDAVATWQPLRRPYADQAREQDTTRRQESP
ncbi:MULTISPECIES: hypothetical protein [unclassified Streptomyces]|uniref:hypothetical protein n=1 Tax=unclassified Streptomyces TaxID=2593676 RepID=UPI0037F43B78